ncbi:MAG TPA: hypothetical protein VK135_01210 [Candidatus Dormibacteraeota bacterium]|nr:hypothetical protein [Candidatus Dormibacteraeota bacterium]
MGSLKDQKLYTHAVERNLPWYLWGSVVSAIICVSSFIWHHTFLGELRFGSSGILIVMVAAYIGDFRRLRRLKAANARNEYILGKEFKTSTYDKDGHEIEEDD